MDALNRILFHRLAAILLKLRRNRSDEIVHFRMRVELPEIALLAQGFAMCAHRNQPRKYEDVVVHCERVARIVAECTDDANVIAAALMHDVLEDTDVTAAEMRSVFGETITDLLLEVTDVSGPSDGNRRMRKEKHKDHLAK